MKKAGKSTEQATPDRADEIVEALSRLVTKYGKKPEKAEPVVLDPNSDIMAQLAELIEKACQAGDSVSAIAERSGLTRALISRIRNSNYESSPSLEVVEKLLSAVGCKLVLKKT